VVLQFMQQLQNVHAIVHSKQHLHNLLGKIDPKSRIKFEK
jgi:hypothetical protein